MKRFLVYSTFILGLGAFSNAVAENMDLNNGRTQEEDTTGDQIRAQIQALQAAARRSPHFGMTGVLEKGKKARYSVNGEDFDVSEATIVTGNLRYGAEVTAEGAIINGQKVASGVAVLSEDGKSSTIRKSSGPEPLPK